MLLVSNQNKKAVVLLSGGLDSAVVLAMAKAQDYDCYALTIDYHQRHRYEIDCAARVAQQIGVKEHRVVTMDINQWGGSSLTNFALKVPTAATTAIPNTWVPARNTIFLSVALGWAEAIQAYDLFIGANLVDSPNYPDCRPEYFAAFVNLARLATKPGVEGQTFQVHTPIISFNKVDIIQQGIRLGVDLSLTHSCYDPVDEIKPCGVCDACRLRDQAFAKVTL